MSKKDGMLNMAILSAQYDLRRILSLKDFRKAIIRFLNQVNLAKDQENPLFNCLNDYQKEAFLFVIKDFIVKKDALKFKIKGQGIDPIDLNTWWGKTFISLIEEFEITEVVCS